MPLLCLSKRSTELYAKQRFSLEHAHTWHAGAQRFPNTILLPHSPAHKACSGSFEICIMTLWTGTYKEPTLYVPLFTNTSHPIKMLFFQPYGITHWKGGNRNKQYCKAQLFASQLQRSQRHMTQHARRCESEQLRFPETQTKRRKRTNFSVCFDQNCDSLRTTHSCQQSEEDPLICNV